MILSDIRRKHKAARNRSCLNRSIIYFCLLLVTFLS